MKHLVVGTADVVLFEVKCDGRQVRFVNLAKGDVCGRQCFGNCNTDTTGAGDVFHGALAACLAQKREWLESLAYASAAGALCCMKTGARLGIPTKEEVEEFLKTQEG